VARPDGETGVLKIIDRALGVLLILGAGGHTFGSIVAYRTQPLTLLWALSASLYIVLVGAVNLLRTARPGDRALAWVAVVAALCQLVSAVVFGQLIHSPADPRVVGFVVLCLGLIAFGLRDALASRP
jgi:drug/metabolite transporter (DMT)-like permease